MDDIGSRIRYVREAFKQSRAHFGQELGEESYTINDLERGRNRVNADFLQKFCEKYLVNLDWLLTGIGPAFHPGCAPEGYEHESGVPRMYQVAGAKSGDENGLIQVPRYDVKVSAGGGAMSFGEEKIGHLGFKASWLKRRGIDPAHAGIVDVDGNSMERVLFHGDSVLADFRDKQPRSGKAFVIRIEDELQVKYLQRLPDGSIKATSENPAYEPFIINPQDQVDAEIVGRVRSHSHDWE